MLFFALLVTAAAVNIGRGYSSRCFEPAFERTYENPSARSTITVGVTAIVEARFAQVVNRDTIQRSLDTANRLWARAGVQFGDLEVTTSNAVSDTRGGQHEGFMSYMQPIWERETSKYPGRLAIVFSQVRSIASVTTMGAQFFGVGGFAGSRAARRSHLWMNVDPAGRGRAPFFTDQTLQHELGHAIGLFHTFQDDFGCDSGDYIDDTDIAPQSFRGCGAVLPACDGETRARDMENLMSYGSCRGANTVTPGQFRRVRCAFENHLPWRVLAGQRPAPPVNQPATPPTPSRPPSTPRPTRALPGEGGTCLGAGYQGLCYNPRTHVCPTNTHLTNACAGVSLQCCVLSRAQGDMTETSLTVTTPEEAIKDEDIFPLPNEFAVYHVGDTVVATAHVALLNPRVYLLRRNEIQLLPTQEELDAFGVQEGAIQAVDDVYVYSVPLNTVDRGSYAIYIVGEEVDENNKQLGERGIVSEVFVVDVNSCKLQGNHNVPYGLVRSQVDCNARSGTVDHTVDGGLVCCVPETVKTVVEMPVEPTVDEMTTISGMEQDGQAGEGFHVSAFPQPKAIGEFQWTGATSFWGAPMTVTPTAPATEPFDLHLIQAGSEEDAAKSMPAPVYSSAQNAAFTITPKVGTPLTAVFATGDLNGHTDSFSVVSLPCRLASGQAGYCRPTAPIFGGLGGATPEELICSAGEAGQCAGLAVDGVTFSCCAGSSSALQQAAVYREEAERVDMDALMPSTPSTTPESDASSTLTIMMTTPMMLALLY